MLKVSCAGILSLDEKLNLKLLLLQKKKLHVILKAAWD